MAPFRPFWDDAKDMYIPIPCIDGNWQLRTNYSISIEIPVSIGEQGNPLLCLKRTEHCQEDNSAIFKHCTDQLHPLPSILNLAITDQQSSQVTWETREAIHIVRLDPDLNWNIGKLSLWPSVIAFISFLVLNLKIHMCGPCLRTSIIHLPKTLA